MNDRRLLFVRTSSRGSLAPIVAALAVLVLVAIGGLAVVLWPRETPTSAQELREPARNGSFESGAEERPAKPPARKAGTWT